MGPIAGAYAVCRPAGRPVPAGQARWDPTTPRPCTGSRPTGRLRAPPAAARPAPHGTPYVGSGTEDYLGLGLLALIGAFAWTGRRRRRTWVLVAFTALAGLCALGAHLVVRHHHTAIPGVWWPLARLPLLRDALPSRLSVYVFLGATVIVALWLADPSRGRPAARGGAWALAALALVTLIPDPGHAWTTSAADPPFFARGLYRTYLKPSGAVVTVPVLGPTERWLADTGFPAALAAGYAGQRDPPGYVSHPAWAGLTAATTLSPSAAADLPAFLRAKRATAIIITPGHGALERSLDATLGLRPVSIGGIDLYRLGPQGPSRP